MSIAEEAAAAGVRRTSAGGSSRSDGGSGTGAPVPPAPARTGGGVTGLTFGNNRLGNQRSSWGASEDNVIQRDGQPPGLAGLSNLGNTCFMNSSLQCLVHAVPLMRAFLGGAYLQDLNRTNPLGMKGELAEAFGSLMEQLWRGGLSAVTPRSFKAKIGRFAPQFSGYAQHDSQEFLAFLLDGLHEDTNRIRNKPYIEERDQPGRPDEEVAAEAWANYRARNDSLVVDHFQGLFKSTVDCPQCGFNSVKFDPFMYLSLPLPESRRRVVEVVLVRTDGSELPCRMALELPSGATLLDLLRATAQVAGLPAEVVSNPEHHLLAARPLRGPSFANDELALLTDSRLRLADALDAGGSSTYSLRSSSNSPDSGLVVYHYPNAARGPRAEGLAPVIVHFKRPDSRRATSWSRGVWCGAPLVLFMPEDQPPYAPEQVSKVPIPPGNRSEWEISGDCPLAAALVEVLRPIQRLPIVMAPRAEQGAASAVPHTEVQAAASAEVGYSAKCPEEAETVPAPLGKSVIDSATVAGKDNGKEQRLPAEAVVPALVPMEEDAGLAGADEELRPGTPTWDGARGGAGASDGSSETPIRLCSSNGKVIVTGEQMEGVESLPKPAPALAVDAVPVSSASGLAGGAGGGYGDSSLHGTPGLAAHGAMEDNVEMAPLPAVIIAGPPEKADAADATGIRPPGVEPFDMWVGQVSWMGD
ncbi:hypothetical protein Vretifemale_467 [Volvox reticuliferus]|uniref:ubiquitinyl hydrolase 1 n=1 Tax=Volvox reticuliferus TaxID=1737510 RepID=A0A8J4C1C0_9CHLO|nr:hypothetical protein Vretifemale_467 [Volvox reticuliferus]